MPEKQISGAAPVSTPKKKKPTYPQAFEAVWKAYPTNKNMSKPEALVQWLKLDDDDQRLVAASIPSFLAYCRADPTYHPVHFVRYLSQRRFDGHADGGAAVTEADWIKRLAYARKHSKWSSAEWGPMPGQPNCQVMSTLLQPGDGVGWVEWKQTTSA